MTIRTGLVVALLFVVTIAGAIEVGAHWRGAADAHAATLAHVKAQADSARRDSILAARQAVMSDSLRKIAAVADARAKVWRDSARALRGAFSLDGDTVRVAHDPSAPPVVLPPIVAEYITASDDALTKDSLALQVSSATIQSDSLLVGHLMDELRHQQLRGDSLQTLVPGKWHDAKERTVGALLATGALLIVHAIVSVVAR